MMQKLYSEYLIRRLDSKKESGKQKGGGGRGRSGGKLGRGGRNAAMRCCLPIKHKLLLPQPMLVLCPPASMLELDQVPCYRN